MTGRPRVRRRPEEEFFEDQVRPLLKMFGWQFFRHLRSEGTNPGWPDLVLVRPPLILFRELKAEGGRLSPAQRVTLENLRACGCDVGVWFPADARGGRIAAELSRARRAA